MWDFNDPDPQPMLTSQSSSSFYCLYEVVTKLFWPCTNTLSQKKYEKDHKIRPTKEKFQEKSEPLHSMECYSSSV